ncbi:MAG: cation:proton antiporter [Acidobacteria bacterium]|nr:cation:proton antiporter [Acidobacteriota bacterium]
METFNLSNPSLIIALALLAGLVAQTIARHLRMPGIIVLLIAGALLGPDGLDIIRPGLLGSALSALVGYAVAVILFEGGMNLNIKRLRRESGTIQRLVTLGALVTMLGGTTTARYILGWSWQLAVLFGALVIVTGPTVISPIVRRIKLNRNLHTILEGEGVLIDPIGAIVAVVALEIVLYPSASTFIAGLLGILLKLATGAVLGIIGGYLLALLLRRHALIPEGLENVFTLAFVLALFHVSNALQAESGIASVTAAGLVIGNVHTRALSDLKEFKEGLTVMLIGLLFVLLAADVRFSEIRALGRPGILVCLVLMFVVRPLGIYFCTLSSTLKLRERAFLAWLAPRGIVAAAVASFFAQQLHGAGIAGGDKIRALVFLVIAITVLVQGLSGGFVARLLAVRRKTNTGYAILGANELGRVLGRTLRDGGEEITYLDASADATRAIKEEGFRVVFGNALEERTRQRAGLDSVAACIGMTQNEEVNLLFVRRAREEFKIPRLLVVLEGHITEKIIRESRATVLFGLRTDVDLWSLRLRRQIASESRWRFNSDKEQTFSEAMDLPKNLTNAFVPIAVKQGKKVAPVEDSISFQNGDELTLVVFHEKRNEVNAWLVEQGWEPIRPGTQ